MTPTEKVEVVYRTLDWMDANPDKTITNTLAVDAFGNRVRPYDEKAKCFCFIGRLCVEAGPAERLTTNTALERWFRDLHISPTILSFVNDKHRKAEERLPYLRRFIDKTIGRFKQGQEA